MKLTPFYDKILVEPLEETSIIQNAGGHAYKNAGKVVAIGDDVKFAKVGDILFYTPHARWDTSEVDGMTYHIITSDSEFILGKIENVAEEPVQG